MVETQEPPRWGRLRLWYTFAWICALFGLVLQVYYVSDQYFAFDVVSDVSIGRDNKIRPPQVILCLRPMCAMKNETEGESIELRIKRGLVTPAELLNGSYHPDELLSRYELHETDGYGYTSHYEFDDSKLSCSKFVKMNKICYSFKLNESLVFTEVFVTNGEDAPWIFGAELVGWLLRKCDFDLYYMHPREKTFRGKSNAFTENTRLMFNDDTGAGLKNSVTLSFSRQMRVLQGSPYKTNCLNYTTIGYESRDHCFEHCLLTTAMAKMKKVPFSVFVDEPLELPLISLESLKNPRTKMRLRGFERKCTKVCDQKDCIKETFVPKILSTANRTQSNIILYAANEPAIISTFKPKFTLVDYVTYVLSCISFWIPFCPLIFLQENKLITKLLKIDAETA